MDTLDDTAFRPRRTGARIAMTLLALGTTSAVLTACGGNPDNTRGTLTGEGATSVSYTHLTLPTTPYV